jgi:hypothetical protein
MLLTLAVGEKTANGRELSDMRGGDPRRKPGAIHQNLFFTAYCVDIDLHAPCMYEWSSKPLGRTVCVCIVFRLMLLTACFSGRDPHRTVHAYGLQEGPARSGEDASKRGRVSIDAIRCYSRRDLSYCHRGMIPTVGLRAGLRTLQLSVPTHPQFIPEFIGDSFLSDAITYGSSPIWR